MRAGWEGGRGEGGGGLVGGLVGGEETVLGTGGREGRKEREGGEGRLRRKVVSERNPASHERNKGTYGGGK